MSNAPISRVTVWQCDNSSGRQSRVGLCNQYRLSTPQLHSSIFSMIPTSTTTTTLPMWRSPTGTRSIHCFHPAHQDSWENDELDYSSCSTTTVSPSRIIQYLNFLSQVEDIRIRESHKRLRGPVFTLEIYLTELDGDVAGKPTYEIERSFADFEELLGQISMCVHQSHDHGVFALGGGMRKPPHVCSSCQSVQARCTAWGRQLPRHFFNRLFMSKTKYIAMLEGMLSDLLDASRQQPHSDLMRNTSCSHQDVPGALTSFLVRQELSMEEI